MDFFFKKDLLIFILCVYVCDYKYMCTTCVQVPLESRRLEFSGTGGAVDMSCLMWVLGSEPGSLVRAANAFNF